MKTKQNHLTRPSTILAAALAALAAPTVSHAQSSDALLDVLVRKGVLTQEEAQAVKTEAQSEAEPAAAPNAPETKWQKAIEAVEFYGDARLRYEFRGSEDAAGNTSDRQRFRYRLRLGVRGEFLSDFYYGVRLESSADSRSTNVTFGNDGGPWHKDDDILHIGQIYLGWQRFDWLAVEAGRISNPLVTTKMVWDGDISPEGIAEMFTYNLTDQLDVFATFGQFLYDDHGSNNSDEFMLAWQLGGKYSLNDNVTLSLAPTLYHYTGSADDAAFALPFGPGTPAAAPVTSQGGINDLVIVNVPVEVSFKAGNLPIRVFGDFAINLDADDRAAAAGLPGADDENKAYMIGVGVGKASKKGSWGAEVAWQHQELFALDPNLIDSDLFDSRLNLEGIILGASYAITDNIVANATYALAERIDDSLGTLGAGGSVRDEYQLLQLDLSWKF